MYYDVYVLSIHNAKVCFGVNWLRSSEQYVREFSTTHGTAPSTGVMRMYDAYILKKLDI